MLRIFLPYFVLFFLLLISFPSVAQKTNSLRGVILQPDQKTPISGAGITHLKTNQTIVADDNGIFAIKAMPQDTLLIRAIGYEPFLYIIQKTDSATPQAAIILKQSSIELTEVEVKSKSEPVKAVSTQVKRPGYNPAFEPPPPSPAPLPSVIWNPASAFSKDGIEKKKLQKLKKAQSKEKGKQEAEEQKQNYNRFFKDNTGYQ